MRKVYLLVFLLIVLAEVLVAGPSDMALIAVESPDSETAARLLAEDIMVVRDMDTYLLVVAGRCDPGAPHPLPCGDATDFVICEGRALRARDWPTPARLHG